MAIDKDNDIASIRARVEVCGKPQVKCGDCPNQAFIAVSDNQIASHLRGADQNRSGGLQVKPSGGSHLAIASGSMNAR
jgi:hypothetical protein